MRETSNPVLRNLPKGQGGYATFGTGVAGAATQQVHQRDAQPYLDQRSDTRPLTIDDVVTKTGITLGVLSVVAVISYFMVSSNLALAMPLALVGGLGGMVLVLIATGSEVGLALGAQKALAADGIAVENIHARQHSTR